MKITIYTETISVTTAAEESESVFFLCALFFCQNLGFCFRLNAFFCFRKAL